jgi:hypothetical protein
VSNTNDLLFLLTRQACPLRAPLRHFAIVLAQLADWRTGRGIAGQVALAGAVGCDTRTVRRLKRELAAATDSPVTVTWRHRSRPDGLNGSDAYTIAPSDTGQRILDSGQLAPRHRTARPTKITSESPQVTPQLSKEGEQKLIPGKEGLAPPRLIEPNELHQRAASRLGADASTELEGWRAHHVKAGTAFASLAHEARSFGGWLKFVTPLKRQKEVKPAEEWEWVD